jgi:hypothetical protein
MANRNLGKGKDRIPNSRIPTNPSLSMACVTILMGVGGESVLNCMQSINVEFRYPRDQHS